MSSQDDFDLSEFDSSHLTTVTSKPPSVLWMLADLIFVLVVVLLTVGLALLYGEQGGPSMIRVPLGFLFVFFLPGYALTAALFPRSHSQSHSEHPVITGVERCVLSVGMSLVLVPLVSLSLTFLSVPIGVRTVLVSLAALVVVCASIGAVRRFRLPPTEQFYVAPAVGHTLGLDHLPSNTISVLFLVSMVLAAGGIGAAIITGDSAETYTEFSLLAEDGDGELTAGEYPTELALDDSASLHVEIANQEQQQIEYTVVVLLEVIDQQGDRQDSVELDRFSVDTAHGDEVVEEHEFEPVATGENLRLTYLLYADSVPESPTLDNAYHSTHIPVTVTE